MLKYGVGEMALMKAIYSGLLKKHQECRDGVGYEE
jgi:hypothetical protein